jgi:hypothetical protein
LSVAVRQLLTRGALLAAPFVLIAALVAIVDPFDYFGASSLIDDTVKRNVAKELQYPLWKEQRYRKEPVGRLILGDSSMESLDEQEIRKVSGDQYFNFAYGSGTLPEAIKTYWLASSIRHLDAVYIGIGLINFNGYQYLDRMTEANAISANPLLYLSNRLVVRAAFQAVYVALTGTHPDLDDSHMSREQMWRGQIDEGLPLYLDRYRYPVEAAADLQRVAEDCRRHGTRFVIVIPPTNLELQQKSDALGRRADVERMKAFLATLGTVYDFDYPNEFTANRDNFSDPFHTVNDHEVIREVWGGQLRYARLLK